MFTLVATAGKFLWVAKLIYHDCIEFSGKFSIEFLKAAYKMHPKAGGNSEPRRSTGSIRTQFYFQKQLGPHHFYRHFNANNLLSK